MRKHLEPMDSSTACRAKAEYCRSVAETMRPGEVRNEIMSRHRAYVASADKLESEALMDRR
jgi:hypothetical protein